MASRRPIYRKEQPRSVSKTGLLLCLLLAGGVMLVPVGGDAVHAAKVKLRDWALNAGLIDFNDCVVTPDSAIACSSHALGMPLPAALRRMEDSETRAQAERTQRLKAESTVRELALEVDRLSAQLKQAQLAASAGAFFPSFAGDVRPTGVTGAEAPAAAANAGGGTANTAAEPQPGEPDGAAPTFSLTPPPEGD